MPRFYCAQPLTIGAIITLPDDVARHVHVLRLEQGDHVTLFNGEGGEYTATLCVLERRKIDVEVKAFTAREVELPYAITLAQCLPEASKMDWIVEKAVELGASGIQPLSSQRCVVRLQAERAAKKLAHWQGIVVSASEQCGRNRLASVPEPAAFTDWIGQHDLHLRIVLTPRGEQTLYDWARHHPPQAVTLIIGPEGGLTDDEERSACAQGVLPLSMGPRVLRTETAGLAAIASLNAAWAGR